MLWNLSIAVSSGTLPVVLSVKALSCGIQETVLAKEDPKPEELLSKRLNPLAFYDSEQHCVVIIDQDSWCKSSWCFQLI